jgi:hypothetical protein
MTAFLVLVLDRSGERRMGVGLLQAPPGARAIQESSRWPESPRLLARLMIDEYGPPQRVSADRLEWEARWPWKRISVDAAWATRPLEQVVDYYVPDSQLAELSRFAHGLAVYADRGELAARSDSEELNRLALNLADDILTGRRTPEEAGRFFERSVQLSAAGKSSPYLQRLRFEVTPAERLQRAEHFPF